MFSTAEQPPVHSHTNMFKLALVFQYQCAGTLRFAGAEQKIGGECPESVGCAQPTARDFGRLFGFDVRGVSGKVGLCAAARVEAECQQLCEATCRRRTRPGTFEQTWQGQTSAVEYLFYCERGRERFVERKKDNSVWEVVAGPVTVVVVFGILITVRCVRERRKEAEERAKHVKLYRADVVVV